jgi:Ca2+-binding EF-hand superfamily protein
MATLDNEIRLANLLITLGDGELDIEATREKLSKLPEFDPYLLFKFVDRSGKGYLTISDLLLFFDEFGIILSEEQIAFLFIESSSEKKIDFDL